MKVLNLSLFAALMMLTAGCGRLDLNFDLPSWSWFSLSNGAEFVASSQKSVVTLSGYQVTTSTGSTFGELATETVSGNYKVYFSVEGQIASEAEQLEIQARYQ